MSEQETKKIEKLTPEQEKFMYKFRDDWIDFIYKSGKEVQLDEIRDGIYWRYNKAGLNTKPIILIADSYIEEKLMVNFVKLYWVKSKSNKLIKGAEENNNMWRSIADKVIDQTRGQIPDKEWEEMRIHALNNIVGKNIDESKKPSEFGLEFTEHCFGLGYEYWIAFYEFFRQIGVLKNEDFNNYVDLYKKGVWSIQFFDTHVFVCRLPKKANRDETKRFHSVEDVGISWSGRNYFGLRDLYYIHGVAFEKSYWERLKDGKVPALELLQIENREQQRAAMSVKSAEDMLKELDAKLVNTYTPKREKSELVTNEVWKSLRFDNIELYRISKDKIKLDEDALYVKYRDTSTDRIYVSGVPPNVKTAKEAMAVKLQMTEEEFENEIEVET